MSPDDLSQRPGYTPIGKSVVFLTPSDIWKGSVKILINNQHMTMEEIHALAAYAERMLTARDG